MPSTVESEDRTYVLSHRSKQTEEHERLNRQHNLIQQTFLNNQLIHPSIPLSSLRGRVADIGCGTGIWLREVAQFLSSPGLENGTGASATPTPSLVGFDLNAAAFPENPTPGIQLVQHDCTKPFDPRYHEQFDLVNIRGLAYAITEEKLSRALENALQLLKPGGYLQWTESEARLFKLFPETPDMLKALEVIDLERRARDLVPYLPHFMLQRILSLKGSNGEGALNVLHFNLRPGGFCQEDADPDVCLQFSDLLTDSVNLFLHSALIRIEQQQSQNGTAVENGNVGKIELDELRKLKTSVSETIEGKHVRMGGIFPHLVAQKR
ncbi:class I SAM-dependent methyltransferase [Aspergillus vadensis CBS 113365]|uniref:S-adenosyl-L-methionine-dependent methyltransferase n=1 Tax=Aspergillus vadensis (strain CBS 113365 / IMI 142717 / IBT 24658) TaxID=1448311 RepID=A0A319BV55_ASPVC|nr:hypothetical protein BO88DRAFT_461438 [Aspergillus vadensis CBS 113365]PYH75220.1 hypothetical protein BO88DRAFT_461438 [Aspergillus vadensis CBS 113365]